MKFLTIVFLIGWCLCCSDKNNSTGPSEKVKEISMNNSRAAHTAILLLNGKVLVTGGFSSNESVLSSAEIYDPETQNFALEVPMNSPRSSHTATLLPDGRVLITGGLNNGQYLSSSEIYDPAAGNFTYTSKMKTARYGHTAVLLKNGKVLIAGGVGAGWTFLKSTELFNPSTGEFTSSGNMTTERESHTATLLTDGRVLITGGHKGRQSSVTIYSSAEMYDPVSDTFSLISNMTIRRHKHDAVLLSDGRVLITGGSDERDDKGQYKSTELFNPAKNIFASAGEMNTTRYKHRGTSLRLTNGKIILTGGARTIEYFDPGTDQFVKSNVYLGVTRLFAASVLLNIGEILITGGYGPDIQSSGKAFLFTP